MIVPVFGSMPPQPEIVSCVMIASPSAQPPTTLRPLNTIFVCVAGIVIATRRSSGR
jgi:hypothetical protein